MADVLIRVIGNTGSANRALAQTERRVKGLRTATRASSPAVRGLRTNLSGLSQTAGLAQSSVFQLTGAFILVGGLVLALRATARAAIEFEAEMTKLQTLVGIQPELVDKWAVSLRKMAPAVGVGPRELSKALFVVTSAGIRTGEALEIVKLAAQASAIGLGDVTSVARAVTSAMQAYAKTNLSAAEATDVLVATVREGNLVASELASSLGRVLGIAAEVGVGFAELGGFIATFTRVGVTAQESVTALRGILNTTLKPTKQATEALAGFGISIGDVRRAIREEGLARTLIDLVSILREDEDALAAVFGNVRALSGVLATAGAQAEEFDRIIQSVSDSAGILKEGFATVGTTAKQSMAEASAAVEVLALAIGDKLLPMISGFITSWADLFNVTGIALEGAKRFIAAARDQNELARRVNALASQRNDILREQKAELGKIFPSLTALGTFVVELEVNAMASAFAMDLLISRANALAAAAKIAPTDRRNIFVKPPLLTPAQQSEIADLALRINRELAASLEVQLAITPVVDIKPPKIDVSLAELVFSDFEERMRQATSAVAAAATPAERLAEMMQNLRIAEAASVITTDELRKAQVFLEQQYSSSTRTFTELAVTIGPAIAATLAQVIAAIRGQGGGFFGAISGLLGAGAAVAGLIPGGQLVGAGLLAGSLVSGAFRSRPQPVSIDSFSQRALDQQKIVTGPSTVIVQVITPTGEIIDEFLYEVGRRERTDNIRRFPTSTRRAIPV